MKWQRGFHFLSPGAAGRAKSAHELRGPLQTILAREEDEHGTNQLGRIGRFSLHAGVAVNTRERNMLERIFRGGPMKTARPGLLPDGRPSDRRPRNAGPQHRGSVSHWQDPVSPGDQVAFTGARESPPWSTCTAARGLLVDTSRARMIDGYYTRTMQVGGLGAPGYGWVVIGIAMENEVLKSEKLRQALKTSRLFTLRRT